MKRTSILNIRDKINIFQVLSYKSQIIKENFLNKNSLVINYLLYE